MKKSIMASKIVSFAEVRIDLLKKLEIGAQDGVTKVGGFCESTRKRAAPSRKAFRVTRDTQSIQTTQHVFKEFRKFYVLCFKLQQFCQRIPM